MRENGTITEQEEATLTEAIGIMKRWLDAHKDDDPHSYGFWGIEEARHQLSQCIGYMCNE